MFLLKEFIIPIQSEWKDYHWSELIVNECYLVALLQRKVVGRYAGKN